MFQESDTEASGKKKKKDKKHKKHKKHKKTKKAKKHKSDASEVGSLLSLQLCDSMSICVVNCEICHYSRNLLKVAMREENH